MRRPASRGHAHESQESHFRRLSIVVLRRLTRGQRASRSPRYLMRAYVSITGVIFVRARHRPRVAGDRGVASRSRDPAFITTTRCRGGAQRSGQARLVWRSAIPLTCDTVRWFFLLVAGLYRCRAVRQRSAPGRNRPRGAAVRISGRRHRLGADEPAARKRCRARSRGSWTATPSSATALTVSA